MLDGLFLILLGGFLGGFAGFALAAFFAVRSYERGYADGRLDCAEDASWQVPRT
jgi:hypothetical protein